MSDVQPTVCTVTPEPSTTGPTASSGSSSSTASGTAPVANQKAGAERAVAPAPGTAAVSSVQAPHSARNHSVSSSGSVNSERRNSHYLPHRSFLYPSHDLQPTSTIVAQHPGPHASSSLPVSHRRTAAIQPSKVHPASNEISPLFRGWSGTGDNFDRSNHNDGNTARHHKRADMQPFPLRFRDANLEEIFSKHFNVYVLNKVRFASQIVILVHSGMILGQVSTHSEAIQYAVFASRVTLITFAIWFHVVSYCSWFPKYFDHLSFLYYGLHGFILMLPRLLFLVNVWSESKEDSSLRQSSLFCSQDSVSVTMLFYFLFVFNASGMRFTTATLCTLCHVAIKGFFVVVFCKNCAFAQLETSVGFALIIFCMLSSYYSERHVRIEFVERLSVAEERKRRDDLLETMLPVHIKENLKQNRTDELAEFYEEVSILFCYVSNFQVLSKHASAIDLVKLINRIVFCFDKATDTRGVYKVEAIAETYMCAAGVPCKDPYHCEKIADMALTMMHIRDTEQWTFHGEEIQLQIGIHSGPVVAGVVGSKTYSYHLFGDTVNTSSRICSSGQAGKIQISERTKQLLTRSGCYHIAERGLMNLKGKGVVKLYWLEGKHQNPRYEQTDLYSTLETAIEESIRANLTNYAPHHRSDDYIGFMSAVEISRRTLRFQPKFRRRRQSTNTPAGESSTAAVTPFQSASPTVAAVTTAAADQGTDAQRELSLKGIAGTAEEMENVFRINHDHEGTPQFLMSAQVLAIVLCVVILTQISNQKVTTRDGNIKYVLSSLAFFVALSAVFAGYRHPVALYHVREKVVTMGGIVIAILGNAQVLFQDPANYSSDEPPRDYLAMSIVNAVVFGLAVRLRYRHGMLVNISSSVCYIGIHFLSREESWSAYAENCTFYVFLIVLVGHFAYKRELGLRHDFLLKCTLRLEKQKCEDLLANMLPSPQYAEALMRQSTVVDELAEVTLLYSDMVGFTNLGSSLRPGDICRFLNKIYSAFDNHLDQFGVYKMDTVGDAFIVIGGLPGYKSEKNHAAAIAAFAIEMLHEIDRFCEEAKVTLQMRIGIHTGKVVGGVVGIKKPRYLIWGHHTVIANLMESRGTPGRVQISDDTYQQLRVCSEFHVEERVGRVQISDNEAMRTFYLVKDHPSVKNKVIARYLQVRPMLNKLALAHLRSCLQLPENSPLSRQLDASRPTLNRSRSFVDIIGKR